MEVTIRNINEEDHYTVEYIAKKAFWNLNMPGCDEHYLAHRLWKDSAYVKELSFVAEVNNEIVGAILYAKCRIETDSGNVEVLSFGPLCVDPKCQKSGIGGKLLMHSIDRAKKLRYKAILICGVPTYYPQFGFKTADNWGITMSDGTNFDGFLAYELQEGALEGVGGKFFEPDLFSGDIHNEEYMKCVDLFDQKFPYMKKKILPHQWR